MAKVALFLLWVVVLRLGWLVPLFMSFRYRNNPRLSNRLLAGSLVWGVIAVGEWVVTNLVLPYLS